MGVLFGWSLRKYVESFLGVILVEVKEYVEGKIVGLLLRDTDGAPLDIYFFLIDDVGAWKDPGKILGSSEKSNKDGILVLSLGGAYGESRGNSL